MPIQLYESDWDPASAGWYTPGDGRARQNLQQNGLLGWIPNTLFGNPYQQVGDPSQTVNINPYTDPFMQMLTGQGQNFYNQLTGSMGSGGNQFYPMMQEFLGNMDPNAANNYFLNNAGQYRDIAAQNFDPFASEQRANELSRQAVQNIAGQFAGGGPGSLRSSAAMQAIGQGAINPLLEHNLNMANMIGGQAGQLQANAMGNIFGAYNAANQLGLGGIQSLLGAEGQRQGLLGSLYGTTLGQMGGLSGQEWWNPTYVTNPNYLSTGDLVNLGGQIAAGV